MIAYLQKNTAVGTVVTLTGVVSGSLIVCAVQMFDGSGAVTLSDGTNAPDGYANPVINLGGPQGLRLAYWLSSPKSGTVNYTWTVSGWNATPIVAVFEMSHTAAMTLDTSNAGATGSSATGTSASATSAETSMGAIGAMALNNSNTYSSATLDGTAVDQIAELSDGTNQEWLALSMRLMNNPGTYTSVITGSAATQWAADVIGFKEAGGAAPPPVIYRRMAPTQRM